MFWNPISGQVIKCQLCAGDPQCVRACPTGTLVLQTVVDRASKRKREEES
jgi:Fe-S-cluster-containing hydrogenase component 2